MVYIGINTCVPDIETDNAKSFVELTLTEKIDDKSRNILESCKYVLNITYEKLVICNSRASKKYLGVLRENIGYCTSLSMGAGEQRVFKILSEAYQCPKYALLLIDELDLLLHENALKRIVKKLYEIAISHHLQIIFTTHSMLMTDLSQYVKIRYLVQTPKSTLVQTSISTDSILQLTGDSIRLIHIYVEDKLSQAIINQICLTLNCRRYVKIFLFGPAVNSFTVIAGKVLNNEFDDKTIAVLDGDVFALRSEKTDQIKKVLTGQAYDMQREKVLNAILQYNLPKGQKPEPFIRENILDLPYDVLPKEDEFRIVLDKIGIVDDQHKCIDGAIENLDMDYMVGISKLVEIFSKSDKWEQYIEPVCEWLKLKLSSML